MILKENILNIIRQNVSEIISILALLISLFSIYYASISHQFSKSSFAVSLHDQYQKETLYRFNQRHYDRFDFDTEFFRKNKENLNQLFSAWDVVFDKNRMARISTPNKKTSELLDALSLKYQTSLEEFNKGYNVDRQRILEYLQFWNKLGNLLKNSTLEPNLTQTLFRDDFMTFYLFQFIPCIFVFGDFFTNQYYLYLTGEKHFGRYSDEFRTTGMLIRAYVPEKFKEIGAEFQNIWFFDNKGILYLSNSWDE